MRVGVMLAALCCAAILDGCAGGPGGHGPAHPAGWTARGQGASTVWVDPRNPAQRYSTTSKPSAAGTLSDLASQVTTDAILRYKGAKLVKAEPFPACPGEAGWQTFDIGSAQSPAVLHVAFTQWSGAAVTASYERPAALPDDPRALEAARRTVCTALLGE